MWNTGWTLSLYSRIKEFRSLIASLAIVFVTVYVNCNAASLLAETRLHVNAS